jgi:hypothetical protein
MEMKIESQWEKSNANSIEERQATSLEGSDRNFRGRIT